MQWCRLSSLYTEAMIGRENSASPFSSSTSTLSSSSPSSTSHAAAAAAAAQLIPCQTVNSTTMIDIRGRANEAMRRRIERMASESAVVVFSSSSCCLCHVAKRLLCSLGVSPTVHELDGRSSTTITKTADDTYACNQQYIDVAEDKSEADDCPAISIDAMAEFLVHRYHADGVAPPVPAIFIGGKFLGGLDPLMAAHIAGTLVPLLKDAGALWL